MMMILFSGGCAWHEFETPLRFLIKQRLAWFLSNSAASLGFFPLLDLHVVLLYSCLGGFCLIQSSKLHSDILWGKKSPLKMQVFWSVCFLFFIFIFLVHTVFSYSINIMISYAQRLFWEIYIFVYIFKTWKHRMLYLEVKLSTLGKISVSIVFRVFT